MIEGSIVDRNAERIDDGRREAIAKLARFAAYTAPAMMTLMVSDGAMARLVNGGSRDGRAQGPLRKLARLIRLISSART